MEIWKNSPEKMKHVVSLILKLQSKTSVKGHKRPYLATKGLQFLKTSRRGIVKKLNTQLET